MTERATDRALSFGAAAAAYEAHRPGYPPALVDAVLAYAGRPVRTALEIGEGTGKATRAFLDRGVAVTATEPDPAMLAELRRHVPARTTTVCAAFEDLPPTGDFDLVMAAASLHWTEPEGRWPRVAGMLAPHGVVASFGGQLDLADPDVERAVAQVRAPYLPEDDVPSPDGTPGDAAMRWPGTELVASPLFTDVRQVVIERRLQATPEEYAAHLATISAYLVLDPEVRAVVLGRIRDVLPDRVDLVGDITLHLARAG